jgi:hypothetical protein
MITGRKTWIAMATALIVLSVVSGGCAGGSAATASTTTAKAVRAAATVTSATIPVLVQGGQGTKTGARPVVSVRVGTSAPVPLLLDTGSTGLQIFAAVVKTGAGSGVTLTTRPEQITYSGGHRLSGVVATATVAIGAQATAAPVAFGYVQNAVCIPSKPTCPVAGGIAAAMARGFYGILGIGMKRGPSGLASPILGMPAALAQSWSLHLSGRTGSLVLGAALPHASSKEVTVPLVTQGTVGTNRFWNDTVHLCVLAGPVGACSPGLFDSGTYTVQLSQARWAGVPVYSGTTIVKAGTPIAIGILGASSAFWKFTAGLTKSADMVTLRPEVNPFVNTGVQTYYTFTIIYDDVNGVIGLATA